jgi:hypothetical protein
VTESTGEFLGLAHVDDATNEAVPRKLDRCNLSNGWRRQQL